MLKYVLANVCSDYCSVSNSIDHGWPRSGPDPQTRDPCHEFRSTEHILLCQVDATASRQAGDPGRTQTERNAHAAHAFASSLS